MNELLLGEILSVHPIATGIVFPLLTGVLGSSLLTAGIILLLIALYLKRRSPGGAPAPSRGEQTDKSKPAETRQSISELTDELNHLAARIDERIELRLTELKRLLDDADARIADVKARKDEAVTDRGNYRPAREPGLSARENPVDRSVSGSEKTDSRHEEIVRLKGQNIDPVEIARRMEMNVGEVELILNLHRRRKN